ncbi:MAG TPA: hypothetical protein PLB25_19200 [Rhodoferax sp.]|nr:hypothetical protein [Rhodoferax sp.]
MPVEESHPQQALLLFDGQRAQRLMRNMSLASMAPGPHISNPHPEHKLYR